MDESKPKVRRVYLADGTTKDVPVSTSTKRATEQAKLLSPDGRTQLANARRSKFVSLLGQGYRPDQACREVGISVATYHTWRSQLPNFKSQCELARQKWYNELDGEQVTNWDTFASFRKRFFRLSTYYVHSQIIEAIETTGPMEVCLILVPPEFGKTTLLEDKICEILAKDPNRRVGYISEGSGHSVKVGGRIRSRMTDTVEFGDYIARFGPFYEDGQERQGKPWTSHFFTIKKANHDERDYSFEARGARSNIQGSRIDDLFCDDIQSLKTLNLTKDLLTKFRQEWVSRVGRTGRIFIVGNRVGMGDVYEALIRLELIDKLVEIPAMNSEGHSTLPELWPDEDLIRRRKQVGEEVWQRTYMQDPETAGNITFTEEVREAFKDWNRGIKKMPDAMHTVMSLDPGLSGGNTFTVAQFTPTNLYVIDQVTDYQVGRTENILFRAAEMAEKYRPQDFIIEMMAFQQALGKDDRMLALKDKYGFRIYPHATGDNKFDMAYGVASMATSMRAGELTIPWGDDASRETFNPLLEEMKVWRPHVRGVKLRQDRIMSLWFIHLYWMNLRNVIDFQSKKQVIKTRGLPWKPTGLNRRVR